MIGLNQPQVVEETEHGRIEGRQPARARGGIGKQELRYRIVLEGPREAVRNFVAIRCVRLAYLNLRNESRTF
jgi:hypothetical protein